jgi:hypothetical protein
MDGIHTQTWTGPRFEGRAKLQQGNRLTQEVIIWKYKNIEM